METAHRQLEWYYMFMNEAQEDSNTLALYTDASGTGDLGGICWKE